MMMKANEGKARESKNTVGICETQPITIEGLRKLVDSSEDLQFSHACDSLAAAAYLLRADPPDVLVVDKAMGVQALLDWLGEFRKCPSDTGIVVWGMVISESEALRFLQAGARGIVRKTADFTTLLACLRAVASGASWMEETMLQGTRSERNTRSDLTVRERQVFELVEQGLKNKEIARELGIRPGTVKIHLKHIFEKTGVRGRYGLALSGFRQKTAMSLPHLSNALAGMSQVPVNSL